MAKYLILWKVDPSRAPMNPKERGAAFGPALELVKQDLKNGNFTDWGSHYGQASGYCISTLPEPELLKTLQKYIPVVTFFDVQPVADADRVLEITKWLTTL